MKRTDYCFQLMDGVWTRRFHILSVPLFLLFLLFSTSASAQITVRGRISDETGEGLVGTTVKLKGSTTGTTTNENGGYSIDVPDESAILIFSYTGFITAQEVQW